ncbi:MAG: DHA2 family efflux MFS transporter permease subunit [Alphaproteobacteria bacterium]|nr:DHA2 family efflux MFS transporter permease subunit [Alphaproteobacteria bacterium]
MVLGMFMAILDIQIVAASLPEIGAGVGASVDEYSWIQTSYLIAEVIMIPLSGWLTRAVSTRWLFMASAGTFTVASVACAFAWNIESLIVFRAVQGFLGGAMIPTVFATSFKLFPRERQPMITVMIGLVATMAPTFGPTLGGWITHALSWHWLFLINLVPGIAVAVLVFSFVHVDKPDLRVLKGFDLPGILLVAVSLGSLQYVLEEGPRNDWFESRAIVSLGAVAAVAGVLLVWREMTAAQPVVELRAFSDRNFSIGCFYSFVIGTGLYGAIYVLPLYMSQVRGYDSLEIGKTLIVTGLFQFLSAPIAGILAKRIDLRLMLASGLLLFGGGLWLNVAITSEWGFWELALPQAVRGGSLMLIFLPINTIALGRLPKSQLNNASGLYNLMRNLGGAIGLATLGTIIGERGDMHRLRLSEWITGGHLRATETLDAVSAALAPRLGDASNLAAIRVVDAIVRREALTMTFADALLLMSLVFIAALLLTPLLRGVAGKA